MRLRDWQSRLDALVMERLHQPFQWGSNDCCLFAADCVKAVTGYDPASDLRGHYADEFEAARLLQALGGVVVLASQRLGEVIPVSMAQLGDIGVSVCDGRQTLVCCMGAHWMGPGKDGLVPVLNVVQAWRCHA